MYNTRLGHHCIPGGRAIVGAADSPAALTPPPTPTPPASSSPAPSFHGGVQALAVHPTTRPGSADFGEDPFAAAVSRAVAEQLVRLGFGPPSGHGLAQLPMPVYHGTTSPHSPPTNRHLAVARDYAWNEPTNGTALLSTRIDRFLRFIEAKQLSYAYTMEHQTSMRILLDVVGDKPTGEITVDDADNVLDAIGGLPLHWTKKEAYRKLSVQDIVRTAKHLGSKRLQLNSQQRHVTVLRTFFIWLETRREIIPGLFLGVRLHHPDHDFCGQRDWFTPGELRHLFDPVREAMFVRPWQTWLLRLALFAGMRQREIAQLHVSDVQNVEGIWCINVAGNGQDKRTKNKASRRKIPVHERLVEAGFLEYVEQARKAGVTKLFPDLKLIKSGLGKGATKWFGTYIRKTCGITAKTKTFHSLRHSFATLADRSELRDEHTIRLLGHSWGNTVLRRLYTQELDVHEKHGLLHRIKFPDLPMTPHRSERWAHYFKVAAAEETRAARLAAVYSAASAP